jgi:branched-chain amino acid transport system permease protein
MDMIVKLLIYTLITGTVYCIIALGFSLVFGVAEILNLTHGLYYVLAGYLVYTFFAFVHNLYLAIVLAIVGTTVFGALTYLIINRVIDSGFKVLLATFAICGAVDEILFMIYGVSPIGLPNIIDGSVAIFGVPVIKQAILAAIVSLVVLSVFIYVLNKTDIGRAMKAVSQNTEVAKLAGINIDRVKGITVIIAALLASIAGVFYLPLQSMRPELWMKVTVLSFVIVVLGGMGTVKGILASYIIAFSEYATTLAFAEGSYVKEGIYLLIMILILMFRPQGLFGKSLGPLEVQI